MAASALFQVDPGTGSYGAAGVAQNAGSGGVTVNCKLASVAGVDSVAWRIIGTHGAAAPSITTSGSPPGQIGSFPIAAGKAQAFGIECKVNGGKGQPNGDTRTCAVYVLDGAGRRPFWLGETFERDAVNGVVPDLNADIQQQKRESYTVATVPSAATRGAGAEIYVSDESGGAVPAFSDGTNWRRVTDRAVIS